MAFSLTSSVLGCKVNVGYANKLQSDRYENPNTVLCPVWNGLDQYNRFVCPDSFNTKSPGCESALDRVVVENMQRPQYFEYIQLNAAGYLNKNALGGPNTNNSVHSTTEAYRARQGVTTASQNGTTATQLSKNVQPRSNGTQGLNARTGPGNFQSSSEGYVDTRANRNFQERRDLSNIAGWKGNCSACSAGNH